MGMSGNSAQSQLANANVTTANLNNQLLQTQVANVTKLNPEILKAQTATLANDNRALGSNVWDKGVTLAENTVPQLSYEKVDMNNQGVKDLANNLNTQSTAYANDIMKQYDNRSAGQGMYGSSYDAVNKAKMGDLFSRMATENQLNATNSYQNTYSNNINNGMNLVKFGMGDASGVALPTTQASSSPTASSGSGSGMSNVVSSLIGAGGDYLAASKKKT